MNTSNTPVARRSRRNAVVGALVCLISLGHAAGLHAQCPDPPTAHEDITVDVAGRFSSLDIRQCGEFILAWEVPNPGFVYDNELLAESFDPDGVTIDGPVQLNANDQSLRPSVAMSRDGHVQVSWTGVSGMVVPGPKYSLLHLDFPLAGLTSISPLTAPSAAIAEAEWEPSSGSSDWLVQSQNVTGVTWAKEITPDQGLNYQVDGTLGEIEECSTFCLDRVRQWQPCLAMRSEDAYFAIAWAQPESGQQVPPFNIAIRVYDADGNLVDQRDGTNPTDPWVNDPTSEVLASQQKSPAIAFVGDDVVVTWVGAGLADCDGLSAAHVLARRYKFDTLTEPPAQTLRDPVPGAGEGRAGLFVVDNDDDAQIVIDPDKAHPTVALTLEQGPNAGRFAVAWNTSLDRAPIDEEVRIQYFDPKGDPRGEEARVHVATTTDDDRRRPTTTPARSSASPTRASTHSATALTIR